MSNLNTEQKYRLFLLAGILLAALSLAVPLAIGAGDGRMVRKIIVFDPALSDTARLGIAKKYTQVVNGKVASVDLAVSMEAGDIPSLLRQPGVLRVDDDVIVEATLYWSQSSSSPQTTPWGVTKVNAPAAWATTTGTDVKVAVIDTGIDYYHSDLAANYGGGASFVWYTTNPRDDNGHGTHVAGTIGATNNTIGVVGVAPSVKLFAAKVLDRRGSGYLSDVIKGIDWSIANNMQVINMSLGTSSDIQSFHDAVIRARNAGMVIVAAAGNSGPTDNTVIYPARYPEVIAVSATDSTDTIANFSSRGSEVDLSAPGVSIYSTYKGGKYATLSGTSMAAPHVAGATALLLTRPVGTSDVNLNGAWDPDEVQARLQATAVDLGAAGPDNLYGYGRVDAYAAIQ